MTDFLNRYRQQLNQLKQQGNLRELSDLNPNEFTLNLSSNDYLGLARDHELFASFYRKREQSSSDFLCGSGSSRLLTGNYPLYSQLENRLEELYDRSALFFNSGYHANIGILPAITTKHDLILSDKLNHASIIDGLKLSSAKCIRYRHLDYLQLETIMKQQRDLYQQVFIVSESIFSMDGDQADMARLIDLKNKYNCLLYLDEAHAVGVRGSQGLGLAQESGLMDKVDLLVGTFGKALSSQGAYVVCHPIIKQYLINKMRSLIFTTALPPVTIAWNIHVLNTMVQMSAQREHLMLLSDKLRQSFKACDITTNGQSNIIPVMIGDNQTCLQLSHHLQKMGLLIFPIRPPTVPVNTARLRLSLCADMSWDQLSTLAETIKSLI